MQKAGEALDAAGLEKAANQALYETQELNGGSAGYRVESPSRASAVLP